MPTIPSDLTAALELELSFESPHVVTYWVWVRSGDSGWQQLASGTDEDAVTSTRHRHVLGPLGEPGEIRYRAILAGNPRTAYRARIHVRQGDETLHDETLAGVTDDRGAAVEQDDLVVVAAEDEV